MTIFPFPINEAAQVYNKASRLKPSAAPEKERGGPRDVVNISDEAKRRQALDQARSEVLDRALTTK